MLRRIAGAVLGLVGALITITLAQAAMVLVVTPPTPEMIKNPETMRAFVAGMPAMSYVILAIGYAIGSLVGGFVAGKISGSSGAGFLPAMFVGVVLTCFGIVNVFVTMPGGPLWAIVLCLVTYIPFSALGNKLAGGKSHIAPA
ncbi:MAG: hypothetical protein ABI646_11295 [Acidobacteriota bacterium]